MSYCEEVDESVKHFCPPPPKRNTFNIAKIEKLVESEKEEELCQRQIRLMQSPPLYLVQCHYASIAISYRVAI